MLQGMETRMKWAVCLILVLLLIDLGQDGCVGKAALVPPDFSANTSFNSSPDNCSGTIDSSLIMPSSGGEIFRLVQLQPVTLLSQPALKIIISNHIGSSGGLPL